MVCKSLIFKTAKMQYRSYTSLHLWEKHKENQRRKWLGSGFERTGKNTLEYTMWWPALLEWSGQTHTGNPWTKSADECTGKALRKRGRKRCENLRATWKDTFYSLPLSFQHCIRNSVPLILFYNIFSFIQPAFTSLSTTRYCFCGINNSIMKSS